MTGDHERAIELLRRGVDLSPQAPEPRRVLADAYAHAGLDKESAETILAAVPAPAQAELRGAYEAGAIAPGSETRRACFVASRWKRGSVGS